MKKVLISMLVVVALLLAVSCSTSYTVAFNTMGGTPEKIANQTVAAGGVATQPSPNPTKTGYNFTGWYTDDACTAKWDFTNKVTKNMTLYAGWDVATVYCTITYDTLGGSPIPLPEKFEYGTKATETAVVPQITGSTFSYWSTDIAGLNGDFFDKDGKSKVVMSEDITLYAQYDGDVLCTVSFDTLGGDPKPAAQRVVVGNYYGGGIVLPDAPSKVGYNFKGWYFDETCATLAVAWDSTNGYESITTLMFTGDTTLYAKFESKVEDRYVVAFSAQKVLGEEEIVYTTYKQFGDRVANIYTAIAPTGYTFDYWYIVKEIEGGFEEIQLVVDSEGNFIDLYVEDDLVIFAEYKRTANIVISFDTDGGSAEKDQTATEDYIYVSMPATPTKTNYTFGGWYLEPTFVTPLVANQKFTADATIYAKWIANEPAEAAYFAYNYDRTEIIGWAGGAVPSALKSTSVVSLKVPEGIKKISGLVVTTTNVLADGFSVAWLQIPSTLVELGENALKGWTTLEKISTEAFVPTVLKALDNSSIVLEVPEQIAVVGENAFADCWQIGTLKLGKSVKVLPASLVASTTNTIYANGATTIGAAFGTENVVGAKVLYADSVMKPVDLQTLSNSFTSDGRVNNYCDVTVNANYAAGQFDVSADLKNLNIVRGKVADTIEVKNAEELVNALQIKNANIKLTAASYVLTDAELKIASGITVSGAAADVNLSAVTEITPSDFFKIAAGSDITFKISETPKAIKSGDPAAAITSGKLWYLAQIDNAKIELGADLTVVVDEARKTVTFGSNVKLSGDCTVTLGTTAILSKCENLTVDGTTLVVSTKEQLAEVVKANGVKFYTYGIVLAANDVFTVTGKDIVFINVYGDSAIIADWDKYFTIGTGTNFTIQIANTKEQLYKALDKGGLTIEISSNINAAEASYSAKKEIKVPSKTYLKAANTSTVEFGKFVYLEGMSNLELGANVTLNTQDEYHLVELLKVSKANIAIVGADGTSGTIDSISQNIVVPSGVTLDMSDDTVSMATISGSSSTYTFSVQSGASVYVGSGSIDAANKAGNVLTIKSEITATTGKELNSTIKLEGGALGGAYLGSGASLEGTGSSSVGALSVWSSGISIKGVAATAITVGKVADESTPAVAGGVTFTDSKIGDVTIMVRGSSITVDGGQVATFTDNVGTVKGDLVGSVVLRNNVVGIKDKGSFADYSANWNPPTAPASGKYARTSGYTETSAWGTTLLNGTVTLYDVIQ